MAFATKRTDKWRSGAWMVVLALVGFVAGRMVMPAHTSAPAPAAAAAAPKAPVSLVGTRVPAQTPFIGMDNKTHRLSEVLGKPAMLAIFAYDCDHCQEELPKAQAWFRKHPGLTFWSVDGSNGKREDVVGFSRKTGVVSPLFYDPKAGLADALKVDAYPMFYWIDKQGVIRAQVIGEFRDKDFEWLWQTYGKR